MDDPFYQLERSMNKVLARIVWAVLIPLTLIPALAEANSSDFSGGVAIGTGYAGILTAPTNGLIIQGSVGIGSSSPVAPLDLHTGATNNLEFGVDLTFTTYNAISFNNSFADTGILGVLGGGTAGGGGADNNLYVYAPAGGKLVFRPNGEGSAGGAELMVSTGVSIGTSYAAFTPPVEGLIVQGSVGVGTTSPGSALDVNGTLNASSLTLNRLPMPIVPSGRLTLSSTAPVMTSDVVNATTIYYLPYAGQAVPTYNGTNWTEQDIGGSGVSLTLNTTNMPTTEVFDVYASVQSGSLTLCALYWGGNTARSSTVGGKSGSQDARIVQLNGIWVNKTAIAASNCYNNATAYTISANQGTYLGSFYTTANGQTGVSCFPASAAGGSNNILGVYNAYNRVPTSCAEVDSTQTYTYTGTTWRAADNSTSNRITWLDGLQQSFVTASYHVSVGGSSAGLVCANAIGVDGVTQGPTQAGVNYNAVATLADNYVTATASRISYPLLGLHFLQAQDYASGATCTYQAGNQQWGMFATVGGM